MWKSLFEGASKSSELRTRTEAEDGLAEAKDAVGGGLEGLCRRVMRIAGDDDLNGMIREERGSKTIRGGK